MAEMISNNNKKKIKIIIVRHLYFIQKNNILTVNLV